MRTIKQILEDASSVAVVGASRDLAKPGGHVPAVLQDRGFRIIPVNPNVDEVLGQKAVGSLLDIIEPVDVVQVFRPSHEAADIARDAIVIGAKALWLQLGIHSEEAKSLVTHAGLDFVENRCMGVEAGRYEIRKADEHETL